MKIDHQTFINFIKIIFSHEWKYGVKLLYLGVFITFSLIAYYNLNIVVIMSPDSGTYSRWADDLIELDFNLYKYYFQNTFFTPSYMYTLPVFLVAISKTIFSTEWQIAFIIFNIILVFFSLILFSKTLLILKIRPMLILLTMPLLILSVDLLTWPRYVLTDTIFSFFIVLVVYLLIKSIVKEKLYFYSISLIIILLFLQDQHQCHTFLLYLRLFSFQKVKLI